MAPRDEDDFSDEDDAETATNDLSLSDHDDDAELSHLSESETSHEGLPKLKQSTLDGSRVGGTAARPKQGPSAKKKDGERDISDLPPISDIEDIFADMTKRISEIEEIARKLQGRKLRVATMCSGTESPLLALRLISRALKLQKGIVLEVEHVFSAEIEPFKQAYIERNFAPPLLFRDVTELLHDQAYTAFGSLVDVPGDVDVLIAGTSCKDFSNLNNKRKGLDDDGTSGSTFMGMRGWVARHRPALVILENVCNAPWDQVVQKFSEIEYDAHHIRVDTKRYYIPHTRTRGYAVAVPGTFAKRNIKQVPKGGKTSKQKVWQVKYPDKAIPLRWEALLKSYERPASVPLEEFLLATDDPLLVRARRDLATSSRRGAETDWSRCEDRHAQARANENLGLKRPLTSWESGGRAQLFIGGWLDWAKGQTERVLDLMEIQFLRLVLDGIDPLYKTIVWNLSQNVDRQGGNAKFSICPCLTPTMIPFITNRGGPASGLEALRLQGIPTRELLLTRESEGDLADLAGNAMSSTVVGAAIVAGVSLVIDNIIAKVDARAAVKADNSMQIDPVTQSVDRHIQGDELLSPVKMDLAKCNDLASSLFTDAARSARLCICEGRAGESESVILKCSDCNETCCQACSGKPQHRLEHLVIDRLAPGDFESALKEMLPMRLSLTGFGVQSLASFDHKGINETLFQQYVQRVADAVDGAEFHFRSLKRRAVWAVTYASTQARLDLFLDPKQPEWRLTVLTPPDEGRRSRLRALLASPVARLHLGRGAHDLLAGVWDLRVPMKRDLSVIVEGSGDLVPTWKADLGLLRDRIADQKRWSQLRIAVAPEDREALDIDIDGVYKLLSNCGTAEGMLHRRIEAAGSDAPPLFLFLDPSRDGPGAHDAAVISTDPQRHDYGFTRPTVCRFENKWRSNGLDGPQKVTVSVEAVWSKAPHVQCVATASASCQMPSASQSATEADDIASCSIPAQPLRLQLDAGSCRHAQAILSIRVPLAAEHADSIWPTSVEGWHEVDLVHKGQTTFEALAWATERLPSLSVMESFAPLDLRDLEAPNDTLSCQRCAPKLPALRWTRSAKGNQQFVASEDPVEAGAYEQALKSRPPPFVVQLRYQDGIGEARIGLNIAALLHRALGRLPADTSMSDVMCSWRLNIVDPNDLILAYRPKASFRIVSNRNDEESEQPPHFRKHPLRKEQLRALTWMKAQELPGASPFIEEEVSEAFLAPMGWRAEGRAERPKTVLGGVLADEVGFGKTATIVGLVDSTRDLPGPKLSAELLSDHICSDATLIFVPAHLCEQWPSEIEKFTGSKLSTVVIKDMAGCMKTTVEQIMEADIVIASTTLFNALYWQRASLFARSDLVPHAADGKASRHFLARLDTAMKGTGLAIRLLKQQGGRTLAEAIKQAIQSGVTQTFEKSKAKIDAEDPWQLSECKKRDDWGRMRCPPLHCFHFKRVVIDEYTYLDGQERAAMTALSASYRWILSGTPPLSDFTEISSIASLLNVHLGVRDYSDAEGTYQKNAFDLSGKLRKDDSTRAEQFHVFREMHSTAWHERRDQVAGKFLSRFARCNQAEIDAIPMEQELRKVVLTPAERAIYVELEHHIQNADFNPNKLARLRKEREPKIPKSEDKADKKGAVFRAKAGDRELRMGRALGQSTTPQEALLKRCSHFTLDFTDAEGVAHADEACDAIKAARVRDLRDAKEDLADAVGFGADLHQHLDTPKGGRTAYGEADNIERKRWIDWIDTVFAPSKALDGEVVEVIQTIVNMCGLAAGRYKSKTRHESDRSEEFKEFLKEVGRDYSDQGCKDQAWRMRVQVTTIKKLIRELATRVRSLRFYNVVRDVQQGIIDPHTSLMLTKGDEISTNEPLAVLSCCGHTGPYSIMVKRAAKQMCIKEDCDAPARATSVVRCESLLGEQTHTVFGTKLEQIVDLVKQLPKTERVLIFVQFPDLLDKVDEALRAHELKCLTVSGTASARSSRLHEFQTGSADARVLLLNLGDASASGANLTIANHAIFVSPLLQAQDKYDASETQAIGRIRRCGQDKKVQVYRFIAINTIDRTLYGERSGRSAADIDAALDACEPFEISAEQIAVSKRIKDEQKLEGKRRAETPLESATSMKKPKTTGKKEIVTKLPAKRKGAIFSDDESTSLATKKRNSACKANLPVAIEKIGISEDEDTHLDSSIRTNKKGKSAAAAAGSDSEDELMIKQLSPSRPKPQPQVSISKASVKPRGSLDLFFSGKAFPASSSKFNGQAAAISTISQDAENTSKARNAPLDKKSSTAFELVVPMFPPRSRHPPSKSVISGGRRVIADSDDDD